jgi:hypothetical protein
VEKAEIRATIVPAVINALATGAAPSIPMGLT